MARSVAAIAAEASRFVPTHLSGPADPVIGGIAAAIQQAESDGFALSLASTIGGAADKWLDLAARSRGFARQSGETDTQLRARLRRPHLGITSANIKAQVDYLLASVGLGECLILEWFDGPHLDVTAYLDHMPVVAAPNWFLVVVPAVGGTADVGLSFLDRDAYLDWLTYMGATSVDPDLSVYAAIAALVGDIKAAGVGYALYIDYDEVYL